MYFVLTLLSDYPIKPTKENKRSYSITQEEDIYNYYRQR